MHGFLQPSDRRHLCLVPWQRTRRVRKGLPLGREPLRSLDQSTLQKSMHTERPFVSEKPVDIYVIATGTVWPSSLHFFFHWVYPKWDPLPLGGMKATSCVLTMQVKWKHKPPNVLILRFGLWHNNKQFQGSVKTRKLGIARVLCFSASVRVSLASKCPILLMWQISKKSKYFCVIAVSNELRSKL